ncbi:hypothetical protein PR202_gb11087 [Eleusine coracana subsp. coracana]|uniref:peptidylprolyl isomerase n=1 Tax=Eleusine coracana subsp. coracana TaxID=191504 RepID=A0AAV5EM63_ELECO|nr:hypothetical protein PR202_gb11087 [Eleusine coracana subsp. coracana]
MARSSRLTCSSAAAMAMAATPGSSSDDDEAGEEIELAPPLRVGEERAIGSSGVRKRLLRAGEGWATPVPPDEVTVHYVGSLPDGTQFASTRGGGGEPRIFHLGSGDVVAGLERGICTMKKGEKALIMLPPLAYGDKGAPGIPAGSELHFKVELLSWLTVVDIYRNGGIVKKILSPGGARQTGDLDEVTGHVCPALPKVLKTMKEGEKAVVMVQSQWTLVRIMPIEFTPRYTGCLEDGTVFEKLGFDGEPFEFTIDEEHVTVGLDRAVATMVKGEFAKVTVKFEYGFGNTEVQRQFIAVPPCSTLIYEVELIDFTKEKESWEMSPDEKLEAGEKLKVAGNDLFKIEKFERAAKKYSKVVQVFRAGLLHSMGP